MSDSWQTPGDWLDCVRPRKIARIRIWLCTIPGPRKSPGMGNATMTGPTDLEELLRRAGDGDAGAVTELFDRYRKRLRQMIRLRLDRRLQGRVDPSDVLQDAYIDLTQQLPEYSRGREMPFFLWLRLVAGQRLMRVHRQHLGAAMRDAGREVSLYKGRCPRPARSRWRPSCSGGSPRPARRPSAPSGSCSSRPRSTGWTPIDREMIALRHFEELSNGEAAAGPRPVQGRGEQSLRPGHDAAQGRPAPV